MGLVKGLIKIVLIPLVALVVIALIIVALIYVSRAKREKDLEAENSFQPPPIQNWVFDPQQQMLQQQIMKQQQQQQQALIVQQQRPNSWQHEAQLQYPSPVAGAPPGYSNRIASVTQ